MDSEQITAIRIVCVDHYLTTPVNGLDFCYSNFRGNEVNQVPVIRIYGSTEDGEKICLHVHGVLPYFYIPYDESIPKFEHDKFVYQMVGSLDKALNIMMGHSSTNSQHVFDVVHVKGIPFYGYHSKEHEFLKISFYNPFITKKAAALFQNAAICGKVFQSFESHIPYILQFFIDYNLYGMSFIKIKTENLIYRKYQPLPNQLKRVSRCKLEADTLGVHILNYLSIGRKDVLHQNPGIAFLWEDERNRRKQLGLNVDEMNPPESQERLKSITDSEIFYKTALLNKIDNLNLSLDTSKMSQKIKNSKFNLNSIIGKAVYPAECSNNSLLNASALPSGLPNNGQDITLSGSTVDFDDTIVDEDIVYSLSQGLQKDETFDEDDYDMLNILEDLESENKMIENDSLLGQLSQRIVASQNRLNHSQMVLNLTQSGEDEIIDSDDDNLNDLNITIDMHLDGKKKNVDCEMSQLDGADDRNGYRSAVKPERNFELRSVKKLKKSRFTPLNLVVKTSPRRKPIREPRPYNFVRRNLAEEINEKEQKEKLEKEDLLSKFKIEDCSVVLERLPEKIEESKPLTSSQIVKQYDIEKNYFPTPGPSTNFNDEKLNTKNEIQVEEDLVFEEVNEKEQKEKVEKEDLLSKFDIKDCSVVLERLPEKIEEPKPLTSSQIVKQYDIEKNYFPTPGPSTNFNDEKLNSKNEIQGEEDLVFEEVNESQNIMSFYDKTLDFDPDSDNEISLPLIDSDDTVIMSLQNSYITPLILPPSPNSVKESCKEYNIFDFEFTQPFYGDPKDCEGRKEIGGVMLEIKTKDQYPEFVGSIVKLDKNKGKPNNLIKVVPFIEPPTRKEAEIWLKARDLAKNPDKLEVIIDESPLKVSREKTIMSSENDISQILFEDDPNLSLIPNSQKSKSSSQSSNKSIKIRNNKSNRSKKKRLDLNTTISEDIEDLRTPTNSESPDNDKIIMELLKSQNFIKNLNLSSILNPNETQLTDPSFDKSMGYKMDLENFNNVKVGSQFNHLVIFSLEIHIQTRDNLLPDPEFDEISALFYAIHNDAPSNGNDLPSNVTGIIVNHASEIDISNMGLKTVTLTVDSERKLFDKLLEIVYSWDPDILIGYEIELQSWGYIIQRAQHLGMNLNALLSRVINKTQEEIIDNEDEMEAEFRTQLKINGRIVLDLWRLLRYEINLTSYSFENTMYHILHRRLPKHSYQNLTRMWADPLLRWIVLQYYNLRVCGSLELMDQLDLIGRTCELAKLFGIQFFEVLSRGSQFRVESMMLRMAKPRNYIALSPSVQQRVHMRAPEYLPLILEPQSRLYVDPVIVLDFQSLYPSMMMAYNYCFSTCLGRVEHLGESAPFEFGASQLCIPPKVIRKLLKLDLITISPCGVVFVKSSVREGTVPRMVKEILDTRIMVKASMKKHKTNKTLQRVLHSRQLGLKLIANVTYGYTAANYSGRMPCVEVADSIVAKGRETLERAIKMVDANKEWNVRVVYGDTDSLFVLVPGRSKETAFEIGEEIAKAITADNPQPVKLKLEKVYQPCILQTKKRYVGYMYETKDQEKPVYEAKGIETVRRDGCPIVGKVLEKVLHILFETKDVSQIKSFLCNQFSKIISGQINIQDLVFAKEFRGLNGYKPTASVPALELTRRWIQTDKRRVPRQGERVPYVIVNGSPGLPLIRLVRSPHEVLEDDGLRINSFYYITKAIIPPLNRCLLLIGVDVNNWLTELRRDLLIKNEEINYYNLEKRKRVISHYFSTTDCLIGCGQQTKNTICDNCRLNPQKCTFVISEKASKIERKFRSMQLTCQNCCNRMHNVACVSLDCPVLFVMMKRQRKFGQLDFLYEMLAKFS